MSFDPDAYLAQKELQIQQQDQFDPDAYLAQKETKEFPTLAKKASQYVMQNPGLDSSKLTTPANTFMEVLRPPMARDIMNPLGFIEAKRQALESGSNATREAAKSIVNPPIEDLADKYLPKYISKAVKFALPFVEHLAPWSPSDFATQAAVGIGGPNMTETANAISNRWVNAPKAIRESRWEKGLPTVGEDVLDISKSGKVPGLVVNDKNAAANAAVLASKSLGETIKKKIGELFEEGNVEKPGTVVTENIPEKGVPFLGTREKSEVTKTFIPKKEPDVTALNPDYSVNPEKSVTKTFKVNKYVPTTPDIPPPTLGGFERTSYIPGEYNPINPNLTAGEKIPTNSINTNEIADSINPIIAKVAENQGTDSPAYTSLVRMKEAWLKGKPENADFMKANNWRIGLGEEVGKGFNKETSALPEVVEAQMRMWQTLRNKIGQISPEIDEMLTLQHKLIDIKNSLKPEAALGYSKTTPFDWIGSPIDTIKKTTTKNVGLADYLNKGAITQGGLIGGAVGKSAGETKIRR